jgi:hypothetical protein
MRRQIFNYLIPSGTRKRRIWTSIALLLVGALGGFAYRGYADSRDMADSNNLFLQSRIEVRDLKTQIADQKEKFAALRTKLEGVQAALEAITPSENTYNMTPNKSMIVAGGRLTIGLVGSPTNEGVNININGQQHSAAVGDTIKLSVDPATACQVRVKSFDMFKAVLIASCEAGKP